MSLKLPDAPAPSTPAAGFTEIYVDVNTKPHIRVVDDQGNNRPLFRLVNASAAAQTPVSVTRTYLTGSNIKVPKAGIVAGAVYKCKFSMTKTGAGIATSVIDIGVGVSGSGSDSARVSFTKQAGTANADEAWVEITMVVKTAGATGVLVGTCTILHHLVTTGHMQNAVDVLQNTSASVDLTTDGLNFGVCITTGAADVITITQVQAEFSNN